VTGLQNATCYSAEETNLSTDDAIDDDNGGGGGGGGSGSSTIYAAVGGACGALVLILIGYAYYKGYFCFKVAASDTETDTTSKFNRKTKRNSEKFDFFESVFGKRLSQDWSNWNRKRDSVRDSNNLDYQYARKDIIPDERMLPGKLEEGFFLSSNINKRGKTDSTFFDNPIRRTNPVEEKRHKTDVMKMNDIISPSKSSLSSPVKEVNDASPVPIDAQLDSYSSNTHHDAVERKFFENPLRKKATVAAASPRPVQTATVSDVPRSVRAVEEGGAMHGTEDLSSSHEQDDSPVADGSGLAAHDEEGDADDD